MPTKKNAKSARKRLRNIGQSKSKIRNTMRYVRKKNHTRGGRKHK
jgi:hypothetical protein